MLVNNIICQCFRWSSELSQRKPWLKLAKNKTGSPSFNFNCGQVSKCWFRNDLFPFNLANKAEGNRSVGEGSMHYRESATTITSDPLRWSYFQRRINHSEQIQIIASSDQLGHEQLSFSWWASPLNRESHHIIARKRKSNFREILAGEQIRGHKNTAKAWKSAKQTEESI